MQDAESEGPRIAPERHAWPRWADRLLVAAFMVLLVIAVLAPVAGLIRGPTPIPFPSPEQAKAYFTTAGVDPMLAPWLRLATGCVASFVLAGAAVLLFRQHRRQRVAVVLAISFLWLSLCIYGLRNIGAPEVSTLAGNLVPEGWSLLTLALMIFPHGKFAHRWMRWPALALLLTPIGSVPGYALVWAPLGVALLLLAVGDLVYRYRKLAPGTERQQIRWALFGFAAGAPLTIPAVALENVLSNGDLPADVWVSGVFAYLFLLPTAHVLIAGGLLISMLKFRLYDADTVITRSVSFGALTVLLLALFAGTEKVVELLGEKWFHEELGVLAGGLGAALAAAMFVPLHNRLSHWAEHRFQKQLIRLRTGLPLLVGDMRQTAPVARIAAATLDAVSQGVRASRAALVFADTMLDVRGIDREAVERWRAGWRPKALEGFDIDRADPLFPLRVPLAAGGHGRIGWLLLGPRPDGSFYGKDERETLEQIADPVARALEIAAARETREAEERAAWTEQRTLNRALLGTLQGLDDTLGRLFPPPAEAAE